MHYVRETCWLLIVLILAACSRSTRETATHAEVVESSATPIEGTLPEDSSRRVHVVQSGDTLFSIAWQHELNMRELIDWNDLQDPDLILVGQSLFLEPARTTADEDAQRNLEDSVSKLGSDIITSPLGGTTEHSGLDVKRIPQPKPSTVESTSVPPSSDSPWIWPIRGPLVSPFGSTEETGDGIGIGGDIEADIRASAPGEVVYAGRGLATYGNLIIVKHNDTYLSAYGHNDELLVEEGETVAQGQVIARMGLGPERQPQVHFEIRRNGTPVDPTQYLPK